jgi:signal transduction histidine kinase
MVIRSGIRGRWLDLLIAAALTILGQVELWSGMVIGGPRAVVAPVMAVGTMAVAFRRLAPMAVVVVCFGSWSAAALLGVDSDSAFAPVLASFVAVGSAAFYARRPIVAVIVAILLIWPAILKEKGWAPADLLYAAVLILLAWSVGRAFAAGNLRAQLAEQRANAAVAQERVEIARELHDIVAHSISVMTLHAGGVRRLLRPDQEKERDALDVVEQTGRQALGELQRILGVLRTPADRSLEARPGLADVAELVNSARATGLAAELRVEGQPRPLPAGVDLSAYRIMQEALTNVLKHAAATEVVVNIRYDDGAVRLAVTDDGAVRGTNGVQAGHGLIGMRERTALYGGALEAGPLPGRGFRVAATIPVPEATS